MSSLTEGVNEKLVKNMEKRNDLLERIRQQQEKIRQLEERVQRLEGGVADIMSRLFVE